MLPDRATAALGAWIFGTLLIAALGAAAVLLQRPFLFPPLGATAYVLLHRPEAAPASPRNALCGHLIALVVGAAACWACGGASDRAATLVEMDWAHAAAAALALGGTAGLMEGLDVAHPPAGATTVVVALGQLRGPLELGCAFGAVVLLVVLGGALARLRGRRYPLWRG